MKPNAIRVAIIEDHSLIRAGLKALLEAETDLKLVGEATNRKSAFEVVMRERPDLLVVDLQLGRDSALDFIEELLAVSRARAILLTGAADEEEIHCAIQSGIMGLVFKDEGPDVLVRAIRTVHRGEAWLSRTVLAAALERVRLNRQRKEVVDPEQAKISSLTSREREVVAMMASGLNRHDVAKKLCVSDGTLRNHLTAIFGKLELQNQMELIFYAQRNGLNGPPASHHERTFTPEGIPRFIRRGAS